MEDITITIDYSWFLAFFREHGFVLAVGLFFMLIIIWRFWGHKYARSVRSI
jgi:hypothetical protein